MVGFDAKSDLLFGLAKQYRRPDWMPSFVMNDVSYRRFHSLPVGPTDERRLFGMLGTAPTVGGTGNNPAYSLFGYPVRVQNDLGNSTAMFTAMKKFRMYQRQGVEMFQTREGSYLANRSLSLLVFKARMGGLLRDSAALAKMADLQA